MIEKIEDALEAWLKVEVETIAWDFESGYFDFNEGQAPAKGMTKDQYVRMVLNTTQEGAQTEQQVGYEWLTCFMDNIRSGFDMEPEEECVWCEGMTNMEFYVSTKRHLGDLEILHILNSFTFNKIQEICDKFTAGTLFNKGE